MEATKVSIHRQMNKKAVVHIYYGILLSHKRNTFESVLTRWMNLEPIIQSKSEREKQIMYTNTYIWNLERWYWWNELQGGNADTDTENRFMDVRRGEEGEGRTYGESNMETYITTCKIDSQREFSVCLRELRLGLCNSGGIGREVEGGSRRSGHMYTCGGFMLMFGRNQHNTIRQLSFN